MTKKHIVIVSPAMASANNGNWQTAHRWLHFLQDKYQVTLSGEWNEMACDAMIALHARRSASSIAAFSSTFPERPCVVVLTGTDLYRDIHVDPTAQHSLDIATRLVVLQDAGLQELATEWRNKACVIYQSAALRDCVAQVNHANEFNVIMVGHLRDEKDPLTFMRAAALIRSPKVRFTHIGGALDPVLGEEAARAQRSMSCYRWLGHLPHAETKKQIMSSHLMVLTSKVEGGANVIIEAVMGGVPVLASDISGNRGMLGDGYAGYFPLGDSQVLAYAVDRAADDVSFYTRLREQCVQRAPLFSPQREQAAVLQLMDNLLP